MNYIFQTLAKLNIDLGTRVTLDGLETLLRKEEPLVAKLVDDVSILPLNEPPQERIEYVAFGVFRLLDLCYSRGGYANDSMIFKALRGSFQESEVYVRTKLEETPLLKEFILRTSREPLEAGENWQTRIRDTALGVYAIMISNYQPKVKRKQKRKAN